MIKDPDQDLTDNPQLGDDRFAVRSRSAVMYQRPCRTMADRSKRKGRTSKGRPIHRASSSVVAEEIYNAI